MDKKLKISDYLLIGSMLFGLFFGAGNLIFPVHMGQEAGAAIFQANLGFLVTGIGLPFLGIIAVGLLKVLVFLIWHHVSIASTLIFLQRYYI
jgi:LIVCS family branched-chain amino acid:cation transporter